MQTQLDPYALLRRCRLVEREALRQRVEHWGPRTLDVDDHALDLDDDLTGTTGLALAVGAALLLLAAGVTAASLRASRHVTST